MKQQDDWTQSLHEQLADYEEPVPAQLWDAIEQRLPQTAMLRPMWPRRVAAAAVLLLLVGVGAWFVRQPHEPLVASVPSAAIAVQEERELCEGRQKPVRLVAKNGHTAVQTRRPLSTSGLDTERYEPVAEPAVKGDTVVSEPIHVEAEVALRGQEKDNEESLSGYSHTIREEMPVPGKTPVSSKKNTFKPILALLAGSSFGEHGQTSPVLMSSSMANRYDALLSRRREPIYLSNYSEEEEHLGPLSLGLTVSLPFSQHFSVASGVVYTTTSSDFTNKMNDLRMVRHQQLAYVGVPLSVQYRFWQYRKLQVYAQGGVQADFCVKARTEQDGIRQSMEKDRMRWSAGLSLGVQLNQLWVGGLYVEPGLRYYFDNGSDVRNVMSERPLGFSLQIGYRLLLGE